MMSKEKRRVPKLRFPGFTEEWEQYRFNNLLKKNLERNDGKFNSNKTISIARMKYNKLGNGASDESLNNYKVLRFGDVAFEGHENKEFKFGRFVMNDIGDGIMSPRFTALRPIKVLEVEFWKEYINYEPIMQKKLVNSTKKGTMMHELVVDEFLKQEILLPSKEEQQKIGRLLKLQSNIINLHQRKVEHLILKKKALLQKLFPRNGNRYPEFRFPGFTAPWEQRKLSDVADVRDGTHDSPKFYNDGFPLVTSKNLKGGSIDFSDCSFISEQDFNEINKRSKVEPGDILFGMIGTIGNPAIVEHTGFAIKNVALIKEGNIINNRFIYHLLSSKVFENYIARENAGGTQKFIALNQIRNFDFLAPTLVEQSKIIELLDCISQNITLHQRKLEHLQIQKKSLLQQLFV